MRIGLTTECENCSMLMNLDLGKTDSEVDLKTTGSFTAALGQLGLNVTE